MNALRINQSLSQVKKSQANYSGVRSIFAKYDMLLFYYERPQDQLESEPGKKEAKQTTVECDQSLQNMICFCSTMNALRIRLSFLIVSNYQSFAAVNRLSLAPQSYFMLHL